MHKKRSYDKEYGKIMLNVIRYGSYTSCRYHLKTHRNDGRPAIVWDHGDKEWYVNGKRHREDGPAVENADGSCCWFWNGRKFTEREWNYRRTLELQKENGRKP